MPSLPFNLIAGSYSVHNIEQWPYKDTSSFELLPRLDPHIRRIQMITKGLSRSAGEGWPRARQLPYSRARLGMVREERRRCSEFISMIVMERRASCSKEDWWGYG